MRIKCALATAISAACLALLYSSPASACDDFVSGVLSRAVAPAIEGLGCAGIGQAGLDQADHHLTSLCYESAGATSKVTMTASLTCKTSDAAFIRKSLSENLTAVAEVRGADCQILSLDVKASGAVGELLVKAFNVQGIARAKLQEALSKICK